MPAFCSVVQCSARSGRDHQFRFFRIPAAFKDRGEYLNALSRKRRELWVASLNRKQLTEAFLKNARICSRHFFAGAPALLQDNNNPDWIPTQNMGNASTEQKCEKAVPRYTKSEASAELNEATKMSVLLKNVDDNVDLSDGEYTLENDAFVSTTKGQKEVSPFQDETDDESESILDTLRSIQEGNPNVEAVFMEDSDEENIIAASKNFQSTPKHTSAKPAVSRSSAEAIFEDSDEEQNTKNKKDTVSASKKIQTRPKNTSTQPAFLKPNGEGIFTVESEEEENNIGKEDTSSASETNFCQRSPGTALAKSSAKPVTTSNGNQKLRNAGVTQISSPKLNALLNVTPNSSTALNRGNVNATPLRVKEVTSAALTANFMKNSNTIVLDNPNSSVKQILVIPNEVLPLIASSPHPITLNVPGVGPVVINKSKSLMLQPQPIKRIPDPPAYDPLCDSKYQFWKYRKGIKRDLEGFSINDRLGFFKAEQSRSKMCMLYYVHSVKKMKNEIEALCEKFGLLSKSPPKPVEIEVKVKRTRKRRTPRKQAIKEEKVDKLTPIQKKNLHVIKRWKEHFKMKTESSSSSEDDENLLVRKQRLERKTRREATKQKILRKRRRKTVSNGKTIKNMKSSGADISPHTNPYLKKYKTYQNSNPCKIIKKLEDLELEMNPNKPVLVIKKENYSSKNLEKLRLKNNLVYPSANERDIPKILVNNASMYNLWFVKPDILDKYLAKRKQ